MDNNFLVNTIENYSSIDHVYSSAKSVFEKAMDAFIRKDFDELSQYEHPALLEYQKIFEEERTNRGVELVIKKFKIYNHDMNLIHFDDDTVEIDFKCSMEEYVRDVKTDEIVEGIIEYIKDTTIKVVFVKNEFGKYTIINMTKIDDKSWLEKYDEKKRKEDRDYIFSRAYRNDRKYRELLW